MTATATATAIRHLHVSSAWVIAILAMLVAGLTAALVVSLTSSSSTTFAPTAPAAPAHVFTNSVGGGQASTNLCPGSVKDWSC
jgi:hypothetical protein